MTTDPTADLLAEPAAPTFAKPVKLFHPTAEQGAIIAHSTGHALVAAVAGAGKSTTMAHRAVRLARAGLPGERILFVTFTVKAAEAMQEKIDGLLPRAGINVRTLHSLAYEIVRYGRYGGSTDFIMAARDAWRQGVWIEEAAKRCGVDIDTAKKAINHLSASGAHHTDLLDKTSPLYPSSMDAGAFDVCEEYLRQRLHSSAPKGLFMDELVSTAVHILRNDARLMRHYRSRWEQITVDEYQDVDPGQNRLLELIGGCPNPVIPVSEPSTCTVVTIGDDDQTLYAFRGTRMSDFTSFCARWNAKQFFMQENFRSDSQIIDPANALIAVNQHRMSKRIVPTTGSNGVVTLADFTSRSALVDMLSARRDTAKLAWSDIAIISRTNAELGLYEMELAMKNIPFRNSGEKGGFFAMTEIRTVLGYLRLAVDPTDAEALGTVWNKPTRYLTNDVVRAIRADVATRGAPVVLRSMPQDRNYARYAALAGSIEHLRAMHERGDLARDIIEQTVAIHPQLFTQMATLSARSADEMAEIVDRFADGLGTARADVALRRIERAEQMRKEDPSGDAVELLTVHRAKGLEFDTVAITQFAEKHIPHSRGEIEEERRIAYVAMTRAKKMLILQSTADLSPIFLHDSGLRTLMAEDLFKT